MNAISSHIATVDYLELLTVQLRNQDPIDPVDQEGLINDLTQFSQLEGIEQLNTSFSEILKLQQLTQGTALVGKNVGYIDEISGLLKTGTVSEMFTTGDTTNVVVDGTTVALQDIVSVNADSESGSRSES